jgi:phosphate:Na+ symporter
MKLLAMLTDVERVGDLSQNLAEFALHRFNNSVSFSNAAIKDLSKMFEMVEETYSTSIEALRTRNKDLARVALDLEDEVDVFERKIREAHNQRLKEGVCMPEADTVFVESIRNLERISDHADNIALDVIMEH